MDMKSHSISAMLIGETIGDSGDNKFDLNIVGLFYLEIQCLTHLRYVRSR